MVFLASKTVICTKSSEPHEPQLNLQVLRTMDGSQSFNFKLEFLFIFIFTFILFLYLPPLLNLLNHSEMLSGLELASPFLLLFLLCLSFFLYAFLLFLKSAILHPFVNDEDELFTFFYHNIPQVSKCLTVKV